MSTALVSSPFTDFKDILYKSPNIASKSQMKAMIADRKAVGAHLGFPTLSSAANMRRNSGTSATIINTTTAAAFTFSSKLNNTSMICLSENGNNTSILPTTTTNTITTNIINTTNNCIQQQPPGHRKLDRSLSEPVNSAGGLLGTCGGIGLVGGSANSVIGGGVVGGSTQNQGNSSRYKTELCRPYEESGTCKYGDKCQFAHGMHELRTLARHPKYKTELCRTYHTTGFCPYGPRCHFIHNEQDDPKKCNSTSPSSSSSTCSSSSSSSSGTITPPPLLQSCPRPKALSVGSFTLMSTSSSDSSSSSSLSESPTNSIGSFFEETFSNFPSSSQPATPTANNAFTYSTQDFTSALVTNNGCRGKTDNLNNKLKPEHHLFNETMNELNIQLDSLLSSGCRGNTKYVIDSFLSNGGLLNGAIVSPPPEDRTCLELDSSLDISRSLRLPIFSQISIILPLCFQLLHV
ncbi:hypothetical protein CHUAL_003750 [Chamberlinius hualienensis]